MWANKGNNGKLVWRVRGVAAALAAVVGVLASTTTAFAKVEDAGDTYDLVFSGGKVTLSQSCFSGYLSTAVHDSGTSPYVKVETDGTLGIQSKNSASADINAVGTQYSIRYKLTEQRQFNNDQGSRLITQGKTNCPKLDTLPATSYQPVTPTRVLDTRPDFPPKYSGPPPNAGTKVDIPASALPDLPANAIAVAVQVTAVQSRGPGFVQIYPTGATAGATSNVNLTAAEQTVANAAVVKLGKNRGITVYTSSGADLLVDVSGYFRRVSATAKPRAGRLVSFDGVRALDTRPATRVNYSGPKPNGKTLTVDLAKTGKIPAGRATAAVINVTSADSVQRGFVQVGPVGKLKPGTSSILNPNGTSAVAALTIVPVDSRGRFDIYTNRPSHLVVDVVGYFTSSNKKNPATRSGLFVPTTPSRVLDTRASGNHIGSFRVFRGGNPYGGLAANTLGVVSVPAASQVGSAAWYNLTAIRPKSAGYLQLGGKNLVPTTSSSVNFGPNGQTVANAAIAPLYEVELKPGQSPDRGTRLYTVADVNVAVDAAGYFVK